MTTTDTPASEATSGGAPSAETEQSSLADDHAPSIEVNLFAGAAAEYGAETATVPPGATLQQVLDALVAGATERGAKVIRRSSVLVNGVACTDLERTLVDTDRVDVLPPPSPEADGH